MAEAWLVEGRLAVGSVAVDAAGEGMVLVSSVVDNKAVVRREEAAEVRAVVTTAEGNGVEADAAGQTVEAVGVMAAVAEAVTVAMAM